MNATVTAILCALASMVFWGVGYSLLSIATTQLHPFYNAKINQYWINVCYGACLCIVNLFAVICSNSFSNAFVLSAADIALPLFGYIACFVFSSFIYLYGYQLVSANVAMLSPGAYVSLSTAYPMIVFLISYFCLGKRNVNLPLTVVGVVLLNAGIICLAFSKR